MCEPIRFRYPHTVAASRGRFLMTEPTAPPPKSALFIAFLVVTIDLLGFGIVLPLLPRYADHYLAGATRAVKGVTTGALMAIFSAMQFFFSPFWGKKSDRLGRRPILLLGLAGSVIFYGLFGF